MVADGSRDLPPDFVPRRSCRISDTMDRCCCSRGVVRRGSLPRRPPAPVLLEWPGTESGLKKAPIMEARPACSAAKMLTKQRLIDRSGQHFDTLSSWNTRFINKVGCPNRLSTNYNLDILFTVLGVNHVFTV